MRIKSFLFIVVGLLLAGFVLTGCGGTAVTHNHPMAPLEDMPTDLQYAARKIHESYRFAVANPDLADAVPCYCGCAGMGHTSSYDCYVASIDENGLIQFDDHAISCSICIDITQDTMRLLDEGKSTAEILAQIEADYARFGAPTIKPETEETS